MAIRFTNRYLPGRKSPDSDVSGAFASFNLGAHVGDEADAVARNRALLEQEVGPVQFMNQVHGDRIAIIEEVTEEIPTADSLITGIPGISLAVMVADCIPLLLQSPQAVAAVHVGRRGLVNDITSKTIAVMKEMGASSITAHIGPSICGQCYEVSEEIYNEVTSLHPAAATPGAGFMLDLPSALRAVLRSEAIDIIDHASCTVENAELFSYRRDAITGRQAGVISL
jgi:YfiH family protein